MQLNGNISGQKTKSCGSIEVICGSMFSGKTEELINRLNNACAAGFSTAIFSPAVDTRYSQNAVVSHTAKSMPALSVSKSSEILDLANTAHVVGIDEAQFFDDELPLICNTLANNGVRVIVSGLDMDFKGNPFGTVPALMAVADMVTKLRASCAICSKPALYTYRIVPCDSQFLLGERESYEPRCREHFNN